MENRILVGISSCLLGEKVRFNGGDKLNHFLCDILSKYVDFLSICPEVAIGLGVPRPAIRLIGDLKSPRLVQVKDLSQDYTVEMLEFAEQSMKQIKSISGYILKSKSPTCGLKNVKIYQEKNQPPRLGQGMFAKVLQDRFPYLPIEEEGRLNNPKLRENFIERLFIYHEWQMMVNSELTINKIFNFHTRHKLTFIAHHPLKSRELGQLISQINTENISFLSSEYLKGFTQILSYLATTSKHRNVLEHCLSYFKKVLNKKDKQELLAIINDFHRGFLPLIVPITLLKHHLNNHPQPYLEKQSYLSPYPAELMLRNQV